MMKNKIYEIYDIEQLSSGGTCIHRLHPLVKLLSTAFFIITVASFNRYALGRLIPYIFYPAILMAVSETPYSMLNKRFLIALPFCLFAGISNVIFDRTTAITIGDITVTWGAISLVTILFKTWLCVMAVLILVAVTPLSALTGEMRWLKLPGIFITMFELTYRYIGVLFGEAYSMSIAYSLRNSKRKGIEIYDMGSFAGQLLIRSFDRADRVYSAMKCRGYADITDTIQNIPQNNRKLILNDIVFIAVVSLLCAIMRFIDINKIYNIILEKFL